MMQAIITLKHVSKNEDAEILEGLYGQLWSQVSVSKNNREGYAFLQPEGPL